MTKEVLDSIIEDRKVIVCLDELLLPQERLNQVQEFFKTLQEKGIKISSVELPDLINYKGEIYHNHFRNKIVVHLELKQN